jgi:hypothetical protein
MTVTLNGNVVTNSETGKTYTYGTRGRKPLWVMEYESAHGLPECVVKANEEKEKQVEITNTNYELVYDDDSKTLTNITLDKTYTFGQRGKRASWVSDWIQKNPEIVIHNTDQVNAPAREKTLVKKSASGLREWHFRSEMNNVAIVVAESAREAILIINAHMTCQIGEHGFSLFWAETDYMCEFGKGMWRFDKKTDSWENYKDYQDKNNAEKAAMINLITQESVA